MKIALVGYMGSGKTTVGKRVAIEKGAKFIDLDDEIELSENQIIRDIFNLKGELYFRKKEHEILKKILLQKDNFVLSVGGGTPVFYDNMTLLNEHCRTVYLRATPITLTHRLFQHRETRPLIKHLETKEKLQEFIAKHLFERQNFYNMAKEMIVVDQLTIEQVLRNFF